MVKTIKAIYSFIIPNPIKQIIRSIINIRRTIIENYLIKTQPKRHQKALEIIRKKKKIKVFFFLINTDTWKYDSVFWVLNENPLFEPTLVICPFTTKGNDFLLNEFEKSISFCIKNGYKYIEGYNKATGISLDIKKVFKPDIVFFTNPNALTSKEFLISNFRNTLTCYITYSFRISTYYSYEYNATLLNLVWINFCETTFHKELSTLYARNKGINTIVTGYPQFDNFGGGSKKVIWKPQEKKKKKIIWAPHWTIEGFQNTSHNWACFLDYADTFLLIAEDYKDEIQLAIKPHPFLRSILEGDNLWGIERTNQYFSKWEQLENCQIVVGDYVDLFIDSDALIHDSGGFMAEYLLLNKPLAYTLNDRDLEVGLNDFGKQLIKFHEIIKNKKELDTFLINVINENDDLKIKKNDFVKNNFIIEGKKASQNIVNEILKRIN